MSKAITLYTASTPNGYPIAVALEELDIPYEARPINFGENEQKSEWFLKINPNGRIPSITDHNNSAGDFHVFETSAILLYLAQHYDPQHKLSFDPVKEANLYSEMIQWVCFAHGGIGPMQGQAGHFIRFAPGKIPYAITRYQDETKRLFSVLEERLQDREWLVGSHYSISDVKTFTWVQVAPAIGIDLGEFPNIEAWLKRIHARPKTWKGLSVPIQWSPPEKYNEAADTRPISH